MLVHSRSCVHSKGPFPLNWTVTVFESKVFEVTPFIAAPKIHRPFGLFSKSHPNPSQPRKYFFKYICIIDKIFIHKIGCIKLFYKEIQFSILKLP